jgi:RsiW-degrading membrane proteinase PrsW (M82 family)
MPRPTRSNWLIGGFVLVIGAILGTLSLLAIGLGTGWNGFIAGFLMAAVPVPFYIAFALWVDRFEPEPPWMLGIAFIWGSSIAVFFALIFNSINQGILTSLVGEAEASALTNILSAPIVEELAKGAALLLLFVWKRDEFDNVTDGIVYASMVGLGFAMTENVQYYGQAVVEPSGNALIVFVLRGIMGPLAHPLYTSMTGIGFGRARESDKKRVKVFAPLLGLTAAILLHATWNLSASLGAVFFASYFLVMVPAFIAVIVIAIFSLRREAKIIRKHLEHVVAEGVLSDYDLAVVTSVRGRIRASSRALFTSGIGQWRARRRFHALATELAFHSWRSSREAGADARAIQAELVDAVRAARAKIIDIAPKGIAYAAD